MKSFGLVRLGAVVALLVSLLASSLPSGAVVEAQSGRQPPKKKVEKKTEEEKAKGKTETATEEDDPVPPIPRNQQDEPTIRIGTQVVGVEVTVIDKKSGRLVPNLRKKNFIVYEDNVKQEVTNFTSGEGPATIVLLIDNAFSHRRFMNFIDPSFAQEIFRSAAIFLQSFVKPKDNIAIVTFSMKPKVIADFTGDANQLFGALSMAARDTLNFSESNVYDALSFALLGGKAVQLYNEEAGLNEYSGLNEIEGNTAVVMITLGIDTFSKLTYDKALKIVGSAGVPIYTIGVGNLFFKKYEHRWPPEARLTFLQAFNQLGVFAERTGGSYYPMTFESELPQIMRAIEALIRNQYNVGYVPTNLRREGKERKIKVEVDLDGDGQPEGKQLEVRHRTRYSEPDDRPAKK